MNDLVKKKGAMSDKKQSENSHALVEEVRYSFILFEHLYTFEILLNTTPLTTSVRPNFENPLSLEYVFCNGVV